MEVGGSVDGEREDGEAWGADGESQGMLRVDESSTTRVGCEVSVFGVVASSRNQKEGQIGEYADCKQQGEKL